MSRMLQVTPIDASRTAVSAFAGVTYRPALHEKVSLISRADKEIRKVELTYYGPIFGLNLHWGSR